MRLRISYLFTFTVVCIFATRTLTRLYYGKPGVNYSHLESSAKSEIDRHSLGGLHRSHVVREASHGRILGAGYSGTVRYITGPRGEKLAVKVQDEQYGNRLAIRKEYWIASHLSHPYIASIHDLIHNNSTSHLVMPYYPYELLHSVQSGRMTELEIACLFKQLLLAVQYMHNHGIAHRDLKLENILLDAQGFVKIVDFGSADLFRVPSRSDIVATRGVHGALATLAPEVLTWEPYDPRPLDCWALGIIFVAMTIGRYPWSKFWDESYRTFLANDETFVPSPRFRTVDELPQVPAGFIRGPATLMNLLPPKSRPIVKKILEPDPRVRATIEEVLTDSWLIGIRDCNETAKSLFRNHTHSLISRDESKMGKFDHGYLKLL